MFCTRDSQCSTELSVLFSVIGQKQPIDLQLLQTMKGAEVTSNDLTICIFTCCCHL